MKLYGSVKLNKLFVLLVLCVVSKCNALNALINAFNSGELSPQLTGRTDIRKYYSGCRTLENMLVLPYGGVTKRPGTYYIASAKSPSSACRLIPFEFSTQQAYIIEMGNLYLRFYKDGGQITSNSSPYEVVTPYLTADIFDIQFIQSADTMYLVHPEYAPRKLTRTGHTSWTLTVIDFERGPFKNENETAITVTPSGTTGYITLNASDSLFDANHVGGLWKVTHTIAAEEVAGTFTATGESSTVSIQLGRKYDFTTHKKWKGTVILQRSYDNGTNWKDVIPLDNDEDGNISYSDEESVDDALYRVKMQTYTSGDCKYNLLVRSFDVDGVVEITAFQDVRNVTGEVKYTLGSAVATTHWSEGSWSIDEGYPACAAFYENRLVLANTTNNPQTLWFSQTDDWENFLSGSSDTSAITVNIVSDQVNAIKWLVPQTELLIGTTGGEWAVSAGQRDEPLTATNINARKQSSYGSDSVQAQAVNNIIMFVQRQSKKIRRMSYSWESDAWIAPDLSILSEHITGSGVSCIAFQKEPYPILWVVRDDGEIATLTLEEDNEVIGWARQVLDGNVESATIIPGTSENEIWFSVSRTINGNTVRYIEQLQPFDWGSDQRDMFFVDCGLSFDGGSAKTITGISKATPASVTSASHGFSNGYQVRISNVSGMTQINNRVYTVAGAATDTFTLQDSTATTDINSVNYTTYVSGGSVERVENTFTNLAHLEGESVIVAADGGYAQTGTVAVATLTLNDFYNTIHIGIPYTAKLQPMRLELQGAPGQLFGVTQRITEITVRFYETLACDIGTSWTTYDSYLFRDADDTLESPSTLFTGDKSLLLSGDYAQGFDLYIQNRIPVSLTVLALMAKFQAQP